MRDVTKNEGSNRTISLPPYRYKMIMAQPHNSSDDYIYDTELFGFLDLMLK